MQAPLSDRLTVAEFELVCATGPSYDWAVASVYLDEAINEDYEAIVELECRTDDVDLDAFLGQPCELLFIRETENRRLYGIVSRVEHLGARFGHEFIRLTLVPAWSLVALGRESQVFQDASVQDIVTEVADAALGAYGRTLSVGEISRGTATRDYCVQYRESDVDFIVRLLQDEGISYVFEHEEGAAAEEVVLRDESSQYPCYEGIEGESEVPVILDRAEEANVESIQEIGTRRALALTQVIRRDFDWQVPTELLTAETGDADERGQLRRVYEHGARRFITDDQVEKVEAGLAADNSEALILRGRSNVTAFRPGLRFDLVHPSNPSLDGSYLLIRIRHESGASVLGAHTERYSNEFECVPADTVIRPRRTVPRPRVLGPQTATVVGDEEIHTDEYGRVQVQLHWEEHPSNATGASCWMRCLQSFAGPGWGTQFIPRVGMEVVVEFLEGNPDRPMVIGCVYNGDNGYPYALPDDKTQSGWRTSSVPGGDGFNELRFEDAAGSELIYVHAQRDWAIDVLHDKCQTIGNDERREVGNDYTSEVKANQYEAIGEQRELHVGTTQLVEIGESAETKVGTTADVSVGEACTLDVGDAFTLTVAADMTFEGQAKATLEAADEVLIKCGSASIKLESSGNVTIKGNDIKIQADGNLTLKGSKVSSN